MHKCKVEPRRIPLMTLQSTTLPIFDINKVNLKNAMLCFSNLFGKKLSFTFIYLKNSLFFLIILTNRVDGYSI